MAFTCNLIPSWPQDGKTALMCAAANNHGSMVDLLVKAGANLEVEDNVGVHDYILIAHRALAFLHSNPFYLLSWYSVATLC